MLPPRHYSWAVCKRRKIKHMKKTLTIIAIGLLFSVGVFAQSVNRSFAGLGAGDSLSGSDVILPSSTEFALVSDIQASEENYKKTDPSGKYLEVVKGNTLAKEQTGTVAQKLGKDMPMQVTVDETMTGNLPGYIIRWEDASSTHSVGGGFGAEVNTWTQSKCTTSATGTTC